MAARHLRQLRRSLHVRPLRPFRVERYAGWTDGSDSLSSSETEPLSVNELLGYADGDAAERWRSLSLGYPSHNEGSPWLRREIAGTYDGLGEADVNVCAPQEGIFLAAAALLSPGDHVVATVPQYQSLGEIARSLGCEVSAWRPVTREPGRAPTFDPETLRSLLRGGRTRLVIANWPHNPTGALPTLEEFKAIVDACDAAGAHLLVDEMYRGLEHAGAATLPAAADSYQRGVSLSGLSKVFGLPGLRIGWLAARDAAFMRRVGELKDYTTICPAAPSEVLALVALRAAPRLLARSRGVVAESLALVRAAVLAEPQHLQWAEPRAGTFALVRCLRPDGAVDSEAYCEALRRRARLMLMPGGLFELPEASGAAAAAEAVRVTYGRQGLAPLLERWRRDLQAHGI